MMDSIYLKEEAEDQKLLSMSKKIKKQPKYNIKKDIERSPDSDNSGNDSEKKYETFTNDKKEAVLLDITSGLIILLGKNINIQEVDRDLMIKLVGEANVASYNNIILQVLFKYGIEVKNNSNDLTLWRKKLKNWMKSAGKPETRGGLVVRNELSQEFREKVKHILTEMKRRCFDTLRMNILNVLQQMKEEKGGKDIQENTCSKHWWFDYIRKDQEVKRMWESLPRTRSTVVKMPVFHNVKNIVQKEELSQADTALSSEQVNQKIEEPVSGPKEQENMGNAIRYNIPAMTYNNYYNTPAQMFYNQNGYNQMTYSPQNGMGGIYMSQNELFLAASMLSRFQNEYNNYINHNQNGQSGELVLKVSFERPSAQDYNHGDIQIKQEPNIPPLALY